MTPMIVPTTPSPLAAPHCRSLVLLRLLIEEQYAGNPTGCGNSFDEILCWEIHSNGMTFNWLAHKWGISLPTLGEIIWDHCCKLQDDPVVRHKTINAIG